MINKGLLKTYVMIVWTIGFGFHPDEPAESYSDLPFGLSAVEYDQLMAACHAEFDVYGVALTVFTKMHIN